MRVITPDYRVTILWARTSSRQDIPCICIVLVRSYTTFLVRSFEDGTLHFKLIKDALHNHSMSNVVFMSNLLYYMRMHCIASSRSIPEEHLNDVAYFSSQDRPHISLPTEALLFLGITCIFVFMVKGFVIPCAHYIGICRVSC